jgi:hypothetical protein
LQRGVGAGLGYSRFQAKVDDKRQTRVLGYLQGQVDIGAVPSEAGRGAHDFVVLAVELNRLAQHIRGGTVVLLPEFVGEDGHRLRFLPVDGVGRQQSATEDRWYTQSVEPI